MLYHIASCMMKYTDWCSSMNLLCQITIFSGSLTDLEDCRGSLSHWFYSIWTHSLPFNFHARLPEHCFYNSAMKAGRISRAVLMWNNLVIQPETSRYVGYSRRCFSSHQPISPPCLQRGINISLLLYKGFVCVFVCVFVRVSCPYACVYSCTHLDLEA